MDKGHIELVKDLKNLLREAEDYQFHDYRSNKYATPKIELSKKLLSIRQDVVTGKYDND